MKRSRYSDEFKLGIVNEVLDGNSVVTVARKSSIFTSPSVPMDKGI